MATEAELAWCAGFFDGEGHVSYRRGYPNKRTGRVSAALQCAVPQVAENVEVLEIFQATVGMGKIAGPYETERKPICFLTFKKKEVEPLFLMLRPYLKSDKTRDFEKAFFLLIMHDPTPTLNDYLRDQRRDRKRSVKVGAMEAIREYVEREEPEDKDSSFISNPPEYAEYMDATREETDWEIDIERGDDE